MKLLISNKTKYNLRINYINQSFFLKSSDVININIDNKVFVFGVSICKYDEERKTISKKILKTLSNLLLNVECIYKVNSVCEGKKINIIDDVFEVEDSCFLLPFGYHYPLIEDAKQSIELINCNGTNTKKLLKIYSFLALFEEGGYDFLISIFSAFIQMYRIRKLCKKEKIIKVVENRIQNTENVK